MQYLGHATVPVQLGDDRCYQNISFGEFIDRFCNDRHQGFPVYLKDWHFQRLEIYRINPNLFMCVRGFLHWYRKSSNIIDSSISRNPL